jgi:UDP-glucose:(heptosyl)LPS alpha-1,3-glucosyltransferase
MKIAFALYKYFPYGGLQRDMLRIAQACSALGASITVYCAEWQGEHPESICVEILKVRGKSNHARNREFNNVLLSSIKKEDYGILVGFNKMPGLDIYYAADTCFKAKMVQERSPLLRHLPRYRQYLRDEAAVFGANQKTTVLAIAERSVDEYERYYPGCKNRCIILPPGINPDRRANTNASTLRESFRKTWSLQDEEKLILMIGSGFRTKGLDRAIIALACLPSALQSCSRMMVIGQDKSDEFIRLAKKLGVENQLQFFSGRDDIPSFLQGADVLIHPAYRENTGTVLLEAAVAGLPVLTTAVCGYSSYIAQYQCGIVIDEPFSQTQLNDSLARMLEDSSQRKIWRSNGLEMAATADIYSLFDRAAKLIVAAATERQS